MIVRMAVMMILILAFQMVLFGTQYCAYRDIFGVSETAEAGGPDDDSQLLA